MFLLLIIPSLSVSVHLPSFSEGRDSIYMALFAWVFDKCLWKTIATTPLNFSTCAMLPYRAVYAVFQHLSAIFICILEESMGS